MTNDLRARFRFFLGHAGYSVPPGRTVCALALARAEMAFEASDLRFVTMPETDPDLSFFEDRAYHLRHANDHGNTYDARTLRQIGARLHPADDDHEVVQVLISGTCPTCNQRRVLASLGNVVDPDPAYLRVLRAELMAEIDLAECCG